MYDTYGAVAGAWAVPGGSQLITETFATTLIGLLVVIVFGIQKFNEPTFEASENQPETLFAPRFLALPRQYVNALLFYLGSLSLLFVLFSTAGANGFAGILTGTPLKPEAFPLAVALILVGVIPNVKWIQQVELFFRRIAHRRAFIPEGAQLMYTRLRSAEFDFSRYDRSEILEGELFRTVERTDFSAPRNSIEHRWARFTCLVYALRQFDNPDGDPADNFGNIPQDLDRDFVKAYRPEYERLLVLHRNTQHAIANHRQGALTDSVDIADLVRALQQALRRTYAFIGCAVRLKYPGDAGALNALADFGFKVKPLDPAPSIFYLIRWVALAMPTLIFVTVMVANFSGLEISQGNMTPEQTALLWALSALMVHGCAAWAAYKFRAHLKYTAEWSGKPLQIIKAGIVGGCAGVAILLLLDARFGTEPFDMKEIMKMLPWLALTGTTGAFTSYFLDAPIAVERGRRVREAAIQGLVTALVTYLVLTVVPDDNIQGTMKYFVIFVTLLIGGSLGFFLPHCHRELERSLSGEAQSRIGEFAWEAARIFGDEARANEWLNQPNAGLGGATPVEAARSTIGGDRVRAVLRQMLEAGDPKPSRSQPKPPKGRNGRELHARIAESNQPPTDDLSEAQGFSTKDQRPIVVDAPLQPVNGAAEGAAQPLAAKGRDVTLSSELRPD
jgi:hypothetical protein